MDNRLKPFAEAIGEMCNEWAHLEQWVELLFLAVGGWDYRLPVTFDMSRCLDFRAKLRAAKVGAIIRTPPGDFLESVVSTLDYIDNRLRDARNRFVHDIWTPDADSSAVRHYLKSRIVNEPGSGVRAVRSIESIRISLDEARDGSDHRHR